VCISPVRVNMTWIIMAPSILLFTRDKPLQLFPEDNISGWANWFWKTVKTADALSICPTSSNGGMRIKITSVPFLHKSYNLIRIFSRIRDGKIPAADGSERRKSGIMYNNKNMKHHPLTTRKLFLKQSALSILGLSLLPSAAAASSANQANQRADHQRPSGSDTPT